MSILPLSSRTPRAARGGVAVPVLLALLAACASLSCGGGTDIAPSDPAVDGNGLATATFDGTSLGQTTLVEAVAELGSTQSTVVTDEVVTFGSDDTAALSQGPQPAAGAVTVTGPGGVPTYTENDDYTVDRVTSVLTRVPGGAIPASGTVEVDYTWVRRLFNVTVGISFIGGTSIDLRLWNIDAATTTPLTIANSETAPPATFEPAFTLTMQTELAASTGRGTYITVDRCDTTVDPVECPVMNVAVLADVSLANVLNPCVAGNLTVTLTNQSDTDPSDRETLSLDFDDPVCD